MTLQSCVQNLIFFNLTEYLSYLWQTKYFQVRVPQNLWAVAGELEVNSHVAQTDVSGATNLQNCNMVEYLKMM